MAESSWSMRGVDPRARKRAREAARQDGVTVGEWINNKILNGGADGDADPSSAEGLAAAIDRLSRRIEAAEHRSMLAITGLDQSVLGLVSRIQAAEGDHTDLVQRHEQALDDLVNARSALLDRIARLEEDDTGSRNLAALKTLEASLAKLAEQMAEGADALAARADAHDDRLADLAARIDETADELAAGDDRLSALKDGLASADARIDRAEDLADQAKSATETLAEEAQATVEALSKSTDRANEAALEAKVLAGSANARAEAAESALQAEIETRTAAEGQIAAYAERLAAAENATNSAIRSLEASFADLEKKVKASAQDGAEAMQNQFGEQLSSLSQDLTALVDSTRETLSDRLMTVASEQRVEALETRLDSVSADIALSEQRRARALDRIVEEVARVAKAVDEKITENHAQADEIIASRVDEALGRTAEFAQRSEDAAARSEAASERAAQAIEDGVSRLDSASEAHVARLEKLAEMAGEGSPMREKLEARLRQMEQKAGAELASVRDEVEKVANAQHRTMDAIENIDDRIDDVARDLSGHKTQLNAESLDDRLRASEERTKRMVEDVMARRSGNGEGTVSGAAHAATAQPESAAGSALGHDTNTTRGRTGVELAPVSGSFGPTSSVSDALVKLDARVDHVRQGGSGDTGGTTSGTTGGTTGGTTPAPAPADASGAPEMPVTASGDDPDAAYLAELDKQGGAPAPGGSMPGGTGLGGGLSGGLPGRAVFDDADRTMGAGTSTQFSPDNALDQGSDPFGEPLDDDGSLGVSGFQDEAGDYDDEDLRGLPQDLAQAVMRSRAQTVDSPVRPNSAAEAPGHTEHSADQKRGGRSVLLAAGGMAFAAVGAAAYFAFDGQSTDGDWSGQSRQDNAPDNRAGGGGASSGTASGNLSENLSADLAQANGDVETLYSIGVGHLDAGLDERGALALKAAAEQGLPAAQFHLGKLYEEGRGVPRDIDASRQWVERAANAGHVQAMHDLGVKFAHAKGAPQSYELAARWFEEAARRGASDSQYNLGVLYEQGLGGQQSPYQAFVWYSIAATSGDGEAQARATDISSRLSREELDAARAEVRRFAPQAVAPGAAELAGGVPR